MKTKKCIIAIIVAMSSLTLMFSGCSDPANNEVATTEKISVSIEPIGITIDEDADFTEEVIKMIDGECDPDEQGLHSIHKVSEIEEFYNLDNLEIEGFELYSVSIDGDKIRYMYAPLNPNDSEWNPRENYIWNYSTGIMISITREDEFDSSPPTDYTPWFRHTKEQGTLVTEMDGKGVVIRIPPTSKLNNREVLSELVDEIRGAAELVDVQYELDVRRQSTE
jgi:hypothetical protein